MVLTGDLNAVLSAAAHSCPCEEGPAWLSGTGSILRLCCGQSDLGKLLPRGCGPSGDSAFPGSDAVIPWEMGWLGNQSTGLLRGVGLKVVVSLRACGRAER